MYCQSSGQWVVEPNDEDAGRSGTHTQEVRSWTAGHVMEAGLAGSVEEIILGEGRRDCPTVKHVPDMEMICVISTLQLHGAGFNCDIQSPNTGCSNDMMWDDCH